MPSLPTQRHAAVTGCSFSRAIHPRYNEKDKDLVIGQSSGVAGFCSYWCFLSWLSVLLTGLQ